MNFYSFFGNNFLFILPEIYLFCIVNVLLLYGVFYNTSKYYNYPNLINSIGWLSIQSLFLSLCLSLNNFYTSTSLFNKILIHNNFILFFKILILIFSILCILISFNYLKNNKINTFEYQILILLSIFGSLLLVASNDFIVLYLTIEIVSLSLYILTAYIRSSTLSTEAGIKYIILGSFSSGLLLFGISLIYGFTGTTNFNDLIILFFTTEPISHGICVGIIFIFSALLFKLGAAPFHMWLPDVYEGTPTPVTIFLTIVPKIAILGILIRFCFNIFYNLFMIWQPILFIASIISIVLGTFILINQKKIKRFLAYSSIVHMGYLLLGLTLGTLEGLQGMLLYLLLYMVNTINIWTIVISLEYKNKKQKNFFYLSDLNSLYKSNPLLAIMLTLSLFSMAGIPPLSGFFAKFYIFFAAVENSSYVLLFIGILTSVISAFYYIRIIKIIYFEKKKQYFYYSNITYNNGIVISLTSLLICFFIFFLPLIYDLIYFISLSIFI